MVEDGVWRTIAGRRVFIKEGQSLTEAMKNSGKFKMQKNDIQKKLKEKFKRKKLKKFEDEIRNNQTETFGVFDENYNLIFKKTENNTRIVNISAEETKKLKNKIFTHNHPNGSNFSSEDLDTAFKTGVKEMRAVHSNGEYSLKRLFNIGEEIPENYFNFPSDYTKAINNYAKTTVDKIYERTGDPERCNKLIDNFRNKWLKENSKNYGWKYEEKYYEYE